MSAQSDSDDHCVIVSIDVGTRKAGVVITKQDKQRSKIQLLFMTLIDFFPAVIPTFDALEQEFRCMEYFNLTDDEFDRLHQDDLTALDKLESELSTIKKVQNKEKRASMMTQALHDHQSLGISKHQRFTKHVLKRWFGNIRDDTQHQCIAPNSNALMMQITQVLKVYADYWTACFGQIHVVAIEAQPELTQNNTLVQYCMAGFFASYQPTPAFQPIIPCFIDAHNKLNIYYFDMNDKIKLMNAKKYNAKHWSMLVNNVQLDRADLVCQLKSIAKDKAKVLLPHYWDSEWAHRTSIEPPAAKRRKLKEASDDNLEASDDGLPDDPTPNGVVPEVVVPPQNKKAHHVHGRFRYAKGDAAARTQAIRYANKHEAVRRWTMVVKDANLIGGRRWIVRWLHLYNEKDKRDCADAGLQAMYTLDLYWSRHKVMLDGKSKSGRANPIAQFLTLSDPTCANQTHMKGASR